MDDRMQKYELIKAEQDILRKTTLLKHRKVSTQLKLETLQRQMSDKKRQVSVGPTDAADFYRQQILELSEELQHIGSTLARTEEKAHSARDHNYHHHEHGNPFGQSIDYRNTDFGNSLREMQPITFQNQIEKNARSRSPPSKTFGILTMPSVTREIFSGGLRAVASLSSLHSSSSHAQNEELSSSPQKDHKIFKRPFRAIGQFMDSHILSKFSVGSSSRRTRSADALFRDGSETGQYSDLRLNSSIAFPQDQKIHRQSSFTSSNKRQGGGDIKKSASTCEKFGNAQTPANKATTIDPQLLAEIEEFENMAALYIKQHKG